MLPGCNELQRERNTMTDKPVAIVVGVGAEIGTGAAVANRFAKEGYHVIVSGRTEAKLAKVAEGIVAGGGDATALAANASSEGDVTSLFDAGEAKGVIDAVIFNAGNQAKHDFRTMSAEFFEAAWRASALSGFLVGREAARRMAPRGQGTVLFTGATASIRSRPPFTAFAAAKSALRAVAQSMSREFGPMGIHVAHIIVDGGIDGDLLRNASPQRKEAAGKNGLLDVDAIADVYWHLHRQHPSTWTQELDLRPFSETF